MKRKSLLIVTVLLAFGLLTAVFNIVLAVATLTNNNLTVDEDSTDNIISVAELHIDDVDVPGAIYTYTVDTAPINGTLRRDGTALINGNTFTQTMIDGNLLTYDHDGTETTTDSFVFSVLSGTTTIFAAEQFSITVNPIVDITPTVAAQLFNINENSSNGITFTTVVATDIEVDNGYDTLIYTIINGNQGNAFAVGSNNGDIVVNDEAELDHEALASGSITFTVRVEDTAALSETAVITIDINDINEAPDIETGHDFDVDENSNNGILVGNVSTFTSDPDDGDMLHYSIVGGNTGTAFGINPTSGLIRVADGSQLDFEDASSPYSLNIQVQDDGTGSLIDAAIVIINLNDLNEAPTVNNQTFDIDENSSNGANVDTVSIFDPDDTDSVTFAITSGNTGGTFTLDAGSGQLTINNNSILDHEMNPQFSLTIEIEDTGNLTDTATITIDVNDINDAPVVNNGQSFSLPENSVNSSPVGTIIANDQDVGDTLTYSITLGNINSAFTINPNNGEITVNDSNELDFETTPTYTLTIDVMDDGAPIETGSEGITINLSNVNENPMVASGLSFTIVGYSENETAVGLVNATDPDAGDVVAFTIVGGNGTGGGAFAINSSSGQITVKDENQLDFETTPMFNLTVRAIDLLGKTDDETVVVNLTKPPTFFIYLPLTFNNYRADEPNNMCSEAYAISTNSTHSFLPEDGEDWYSITTIGSGNVTVTLSNYVPVGQIIAYSGSCSSLNFLQNNGDQSSTKVLNLGNLAAGTYYVRIVTNVPYNSTQSYNLHISAP